MRDLISHFGNALALGPAVLTADTTSSAIDLQGFDSAVVNILVGIGGITFSTVNKIEFTITHSKDNVTYDPVVASDVRLGAGADASVGTGGIVRSLVAAHAAPTAVKIGYIGDRRYLKVTADFSGTHGTGTPVCVNVVKGHAQSEPVA
jgi:hypothetical protein